MRVLLISGAFPPNRGGGDGVAAEQLAQGLHGQGHDVYVFTAVAAVDRRAGSLIRWQHAGVPVLGLATGAAAVSQPLLQQQLMAVAKRVRPDVVHLHSAQHLDAGTVHAVAGLGLPWTARTTTAHAAATALRRGAARVAVSTETERRRLGDEGIDPDLLTVVPAGAAPPQPHRRPSTPTGVLRLGYLGGLDPASGHELLVEALNLAARTDYELHVVDEGTLRGTRTIREWDFAIPGLLRIAPGFEPAQRDHFFSRIDALLWLPQADAGPGLAVREALLRGVWPIASRCDAALEVIVDGANGTTVPIGSAGAVAEAVSALLVRGRGGLAPADASMVPTTAMQVAAAEGLFQAATVSA